MSCPVLCLRIRGLITNNHSIVTCKVNVHCTIMSCCYRVTLLSLVTLLHNCVIKGWDVLVRPWCDGICNACNVLLQHPYRWTGPTAADLNDSQIAELQVSKFTEKNQEHSVRKCQQNCRVFYHKIQLQFPHSSAD